MNNLRKHWTAVSTLLDLSTSVYFDLPPEIESASTDRRAETLQLS